MSCFATNAQSGREAVQIRRLSAREHIFRESQSPNFIHFNAKGTKLFPNQTSTGEFFLGHGFSNLSVENAPGGEKVGAVRIQTVVTKGYATVDNAPMRPWWQLGPWFMTSRVRAPATQYLF